MEKILYQQLKSTFYDWCCSLSLDECASNSDLMMAIEQVESLLMAASE